MAADGRILCVDDEPRILSGLERVLSDRFHVETATSGAAGLELLQRRGPFDVVVSDMRMPEMDGATFLLQVKAAAPDTTRVLLTGHTDFEAAISAVNQGEIFRFLRKPCPLDVLTATLEQAVRQHHLVVSERVLLDQTLKGSVQMLTDLLGLANPLAFGRAKRIRDIVVATAARLGVPDLWPIEIAALLSQIGAITLHPSTVERLYRGEPLDEEEKKAADRLATVASQLLENIPRMEGVRRILECAEKRFDGSGSAAGDVGGDEIPLGARLLKAVADLDWLESRGLTRALALRKLQTRAGWYDPRVLDTLAAVPEGNAKQTTPHDATLTDLRTRQVLAEDVVTAGGLLLVPKGHEVTQALLERMRSFARSGELKLPLRVYDAYDAAQTTADLWVS
ncbi:MAG: response regulator [bacterium]